MTQLKEKNNDYHPYICFYFWSFLRIQNKNQNHKNNIYKTYYLTEVTEAT